MIIILIIPTTYSAFIKLYADGAKQFFLSCQLILTAMWASPSFAAEGTRAKRELRHLAQVHMSSVTVEAGFQPAPLTPEHDLFATIMYLFLRERGREREREGNINVWLPLMWPHWGPGPQHRHVPWLGIERRHFSWQSGAQSPEPHQPGLYPWVLFRWVTRNNYSGQRLCLAGCALARQRKQCNRSVCFISYCSG